MLEQLSEEEITEYASDAQTIQAPTGTDFSVGARVGRTIPAKWWNWLFNAITKRLVQGRNDSQQLLNELKSVVTDAGITVSDDSNTQLTEGIETKGAEAVDRFLYSKRAFFKDWQLSSYSITLPTSVTRIIPMATQHIGLCFFQYLMVMHTNSPSVLVVVNDEHNNWHRLYISSVTEHDFSICTVHVGDTWYTVLQGDYALLVYKTSNFEHWEQITIPVTHSNLMGYCVDYGGVVFLCVSYINANNTGVSETYQLSDVGTLVKYSDGWCMGRYSGYGEQEYRGAPYSAVFCAAGGNKYISGTKVYDRLNSYVTEFNNAARGNFQLDNGKILRCAVYPTPMLQLYDGSTITDIAAIRMIIYEPVTRAVLVNFTGEDVYKITFDGTTFTETNLGYGTGTGPRIPNDGGIFYNNGRYYAAGNKVYSTDGITWQQLRTDAGSIMFDTGIPGTIVWYISDDAFEISRDDGLTWEPATVPSEIAFGLITREYVDGIYRYNFVHNRERLIFKAGINFRTGVQPYYLTFYAAQTTDTINKPSRSMILR